MKNKLLILGFVISKIVTSCNEPCYKISATFTNNSGKDIEIYSYNRYYTIPPNTIKIVAVKKDSSYTRRGESCPPEWQSYDFYSLFMGDSIVIDFGDKTEYFSMREHNGFTGQKPSTNNVYTLTPEDYVNATPKP